MINYFEGCDPASTAYNAACWYPENYFIVALLVIGTTIMLFLMWNEKFEKNKKMQKMLLSRSLWRSLTSGLLFWAIGTGLLWIALQITGRYGLSLWMATAMTTPIMFIIKYVVNKHYVFKNE